MDAANRRTNAERDGTGADDTRDGWRIRTKYDWIFENVSYLTIIQPGDLDRLLVEMRRSPWVALDTEFISEGRYEPELCLIQVAMEDRLALIDPLSVGALEPFWETLCDDVGEVIVHACRSEMEFCFRSLGRIPGEFFDVQLAAGFVGIDFPSGFRTLLDRLLRLDLAKAEARTDWRKRPLSRLQIEYALGDVRHLRTMTNKLRRRLKELRRLDWYYEENALIADRLERDFRTPRWRNTPKSANLKPRELAVVRELWMLRDRIAKRNNQVPNRILRDDLIVELARKGSADPKRIASIRGLPGGTRLFDEIVEAVSRAFELAPTEWPRPSERHSYPQYAVTVQFLFAALGLLCKQEGIALGLVGGPSDVRELVASSFGTLPKGITPRLTRGWRAELVGDLLDDLLHGKTAMRLLREDIEKPLEFIRLESFDEGRGEGGVGAGSARR
ncbi:MAG TPA: hypothetical protein DEB39_07395 [Planctomycetaceae bacterium]|nr:hypothetical protein [Planctomycetaceae bacterium]